MNKVPDRAKLRREYLWKKRGSYSLATICWFVSSAGFALFTLISLFMLAVASDCSDIGSSVPPRKVYQTFAPWLIGCLVAGGVGLVGCYKAKKHADILPHVPPVSEQIATLPAEEVLLRGSQASATSPDELLRPAGKQETPPGHLLRPL